MGRDKILQQIPLKHPQIAPNTHGKKTEPFDNHKKRDFKSLKSNGVKGLV